MNRLEPRIATQLAGPPEVTGQCCLGPQQGPAGGGGGGGRGMAVCATADTMLLLPTNGGLCWPPTRDGYGRSNRGL